MTEREFLFALYRLTETNKKVSVLIENFLKEHENDYKFDLPPLGRSDFLKHEMSEEDKHLENFYCGGL